MSDVDAMNDGVVELLVSSLSGRRVFDSWSIRLSETVFFCKNPDRVPTYYVQCTMVVHSDHH